MPPSPNQPILTEFSYRPRQTPMLLSALFFAVCGVVLTLKAAGSGELPDWVMAGLSWGFVAIGLAALVTGALRPQRIALTPDGIILPESRWSKREREILLASMWEVSRMQVSGQRFLRIHLPEETLTLTAGMLPNDEAFRAIEQHLIGSEAIADFPLEASQQPGPRPLSMWHYLAIKVMTLLSFCGGPLYLTDLMEPSLGDPGAFLANFAPLALMLFGTFCLAEDELVGFPRLVARAGALGAVLLAGQSVFAIVHMLAGNPHPNSGLIVFGTVVSVVALGGYVWMWRRRV